MFDREWRAQGVSFVPELLDLQGRLKIARSQNVWDVDFENGLQPLRWENFISGTATVTHQAQAGGVAMQANANGAIAIRQARPYFRYQPSKSLASKFAVLFGAPQALITRRCGMFDSDNGVFFEQDSTGLFAVRRSNVGGLGVGASGVTDLRVPQAQWNLDPLDGSGPSRVTLNAALIQMAVIEFAWYGAGVARLGFEFNNRILWVHAFQQANQANAVLPWSRSGNLPCRYELRRGAGGANAVFWHWGVSITYEGGFDEQRGFTFPHSNGAARIGVTTRRPVLSSRLRPFSAIAETNSATGGSASGLTRTGAGWTPDIYRGRYVQITGGTGAGQIARITGNTVDTLTCDNPLTLSAAPFGVAPAAASTYEIGIVNRGQLRPEEMQVSADGAAFLELVIGATLTTPTWTDIGGNSFAQQDVAAAALASGERLWSGYSAAGTLTVNLRALQALAADMAGNTPEQLTLVATALTGTVNVGASILWTEAMA